MRNAVLMGTEWMRAWGDVGSGDDVEEVLVRAECCMGDEL